MSGSHTRILKALLPLAVWSLSQTWAQQNPTARQVGAENVVRELYNLVSFPAGTAPDWDRVREAFIEEAVIVLRTSPENSTIFSLEGFVADFVSFVERVQADQGGFQERILRLKSRTFGDTAHILVLYEASIPGSSRAPQQGVDSFLLIRKDGVWKIVAVTNELPSTEHPLPPELR